MNKILLLAPLLLLSACTAPLAGIPAQTDDAVIKVDEFSPSDPSWTKVGQDAWVRVTDTPESFRLETHSASQAGEAALHTYLVSYKASLSGSTGMQALKDAKQSQIDRALAMLADLPAISSLNVKPQDGGACSGSASATTLRTSTAPGAKGYANGYSCVVSANADAYAMACSTGGICDSRSANGNPGASASYASYAKASGAMCQASASATGWGWIQGSGLQRAYDSDGITIPYCTP